MRPIQGRADKQSRQTEQKTGAGTGQEQGRNRDTGRAHRMCGHARASWPRFFFFVFVLCSLFPFSCLSCLSVPDSFPLCLFLSPVRPHTSLSRPCSHRPVLSLLSLSSSSSIHLPLLPFSSSTLQSRPQPRILPSSCRPSRVLHLPSSLPNVRRAHARDAPALQPRTLLPQVRNPIEHPCPTLESDSGPQFTSTRFWRMVLV